MIGIDRNPFGELEGVEVEGAGGTIISVRARQIALTPQSITLTPDWKIEVRELIGELSTLRKRVNALESLKGTDQIDGEIYAEILAAQKAGYLERVKNAEALAASIETSLKSINGQISSLTRYLVNAKLDHKSGKLDDASLRLAEGSIGPNLRPLITERNDLSAALNDLEKLLPSHVSVS